jgi:hypothetical protein
LGEPRGLGQAKLIRWLTERRSFAISDQRKGTKNPVPVTLTIGDDSGTTSVKADIEKDFARRDDD